MAEEACFDRSEASHAVSLCDMHAKYAEVMKVGDGLAAYSITRLAQLLEKLHGRPGRG
jgi:maleamate amidohydrolase